MKALVEGALAGYGIAIPVGAIAVLIVDVGLRLGYLPGFLAGAGAATADALYAALAVIAGELLASMLKQYAPPLRFVSALVLLSIGVVGLWRATRQSRQGISSQTLKGGPGQIYMQFLGLTLINPLTVVYFSALILGGTLGDGAALVDRVAFVTGAGLASLSWQTLLACIGAFASTKLPARFKVLTSFLGNLVVIGFGLRILWRVTLSS
jgi:arginine exporter protein ArgO